MMNPMTKPAIKLIVGTPCYGGQVTAVYANSLLKLKDACNQRGDIDLRIKMLWGDALITRARQDLIAQFLEIPEATHFLFIDADIGFEPDQVFRLLKFDADIAAGVYPAKSINWERAAALAREGASQIPSKSLSYVVGVEDPDKIVFRDGFAKALYAGTGFMMIKRNVILRMIEKYSDLRYKSQFAVTESQNTQWFYALFNCIVDQKSGAYLSEDFSFCRRWSEMGGEIWVDLHSKLTHVGAIAFDGDVATQFPKLPS